MRKDNISQTWLFQLSDGLYKLKHKELVLFVFFLKKTLQYSFHNHIFFLPLLEARKKYYITYIYFFHSCSGHIFPLLDALTALISTVGLK